MSKSIDPKSLMSMYEAADYLGVSYDTVRSYVSKGVEVTVKKKPVMVKLKAIRRNRQSFGTTAEYCQQFLRDINPETIGKK